MQEDICFHGLRFELTCYACPEQYDVYLLDKQVGYVRLRWGYVRAEYPDVGGKQVYGYTFDDEFQGYFRTDDERDHHLEKIAIALDKEINGEVVERDTLRS